jgi:antirestriction protein
MPNIYVADLAAYNAGILHGRRIEASTDIAAMQSEVADMLRNSPCPNVMRAEYENENGERHISSGTNGEFPPSYESEDGEAWTRIGEPFPSAEEWAIHDSEELGDIGEYAGLAEVAKRCAVADLAEDRAIPFAVLLAWIEDVRDLGDDIDDIERALDDSYDGTAETWADFAEQTTEETHDMSDLPEWVLGHIDWESIGRDWQLSGDWSTYHDGQFGDLYFFRNT